MQSLDGGVISSMGVRCGGWGVGERGGRHTTATLHSAALRRAESLSLAITVR